MKKKNKKILLIEDDSNFAFILKERFSQEGFSVVHVEDGKEALSILKKENFDLAISDVLLPVVNGVELAKSIRTNYPQLPIILLTNIKDENNWQIVRKMKKVEYLIKSEHSIKEIIERVVKILK